MTMIDASGNGNNGAYMGATDPSMFVPGFVGTDLAATLNQDTPTGTSVWGQVNATLIDPTLPYSIEIWVEPLTSDGLVYQVLFAASADNSQFVYVNIGATGNVQLQAQGSVGTEDYFAPPGTFPMDAVGHHLVITVNPGSATFYVDGAAVDTETSVTTPFTMPLSILYVGRLASYSGPPGMTILSDELAIYPVELASGRVAAHFAAAGDSAAYAASVLADTPTAFYHLNDVPAAATFTEGPTVRLVTSRALAVPHQVQRWVLPIICKRFANIGPDDHIEAQQDVAAVREFFLGLRRSGTPVAFQEGASRHLVVVRDVSFPDGMVEQWGNQRDGMEGLLMVTVDSTQG